eukprot:5039103-Amphidinium_carterae.1
MATSVAVPASTHLRRRTSGHLGINEDLPLNDTPISQVMSPIRLNRGTTQASQREMTPRTWRKVHRGSSAMHDARIEAIQHGLDVYTEATHVMMLHQGTLCTSSS